MIWLLPLVAVLTLPLFVITTLPFLILVFAMIFISPANRR